MKKIWGVLVLGVILFNSPLNAKQTKWVRGQIYENEVTWIKNTKHLLPPGEKFKLMSSSQWRSWGIEINGKWLISTKGNLYHQSLALDRIGSNKYLAYLKVYYQQIFFKNKYDGCYPRSEYTVMKRRKKGGFFNCFIVRHYDIQKILYAPDDPQRTTVKLKYAIKKYGVELPRIALCAETYFYAQSISKYVMAIEYCVNPETNGASKNEYTSEEASEYHPQNINKYPDNFKGSPKEVSACAFRHLPYFGAATPSKLYLDSLGSSLTRAHDKRPNHYIKQWIPSMLSSLNKETLSYILNNFIIPLKTIKHLTPRSKDIMILLLSKLFISFDGQTRGHKATDGCGTIKLMDNLKDLPLLKKESIRFVKKIKQDSYKIIFKDKSTPIISGLLVCPK